MKTFQKISDYCKSNRLKAAGIYCLFVIALNTYFLAKYTIADPHIQKIIFSSGISRHQLLVYALPGDASGFDINRPIQAREIQKGEFVFEPALNETRKFRIYIGADFENVSISSPSLICSGITQTLSIKDFKTSNISSVNNNAGDIQFSSRQNGFFELKMERITASEFIGGEMLIIILSVFLCWLCIYTFYEFLLRGLQPLHLKTLAASLFFISIFFPDPVFNVLFILSFALSLPNFSYKKFRANKTGLLFLLYFFFFLLNNALFSQGFNWPLTETMLPFFFLPFYFACIPRAGYLKLLPLTAFLLVLYFLSSSLIDTVIYRNFAYFSFDAFTKYLHPVYFSYLLFFSLCYLEVRGAGQFNKLLLLPVLLLGLVCCGSKLIISLAVLFYGARLFRKRKALGIAAVLVIAAAVLAFAPTRKRFQEIADLHNLSILSDHPLKSLHDARLNGLTLRLIIWQESLDAMDGVKDVLFGKGVDKNAEKVLQERLAGRGLEIGQTKYDPHNQFIAAYYKMGLAGLLTLLLICAYLFYLARKKANPLLFYSVLLFMLAMVTESVLQRVTGIYFFICVLLLLSDSIIINPAYYFENSDTRHQGNSQ